MPHTIDLSKERIDLDEDYSKIPDDIQGLLVTYKDDQIDESVNSALKKKSRVRYRCMDVFGDFLAFGTSGGAIYLYKLKQMTHSSCELATIIACGQGPIEVIKFLPNTQTDDLLIAVGTSRGSLVVFGLYQLPDDENPSSSELYRAECFTNGPAVKFIECDLDLLDPISSFTRLYICDTENRLYILESSYIYNSKHALRLKFYVNKYMPTLIFSVTDSNIHQISVHRSQLLISTDETTRLFNDQSNQLKLIGKKKRKEGFYGACFFNPNYKPAQVLPTGYKSSQHLASAYSSTNSLADLDNLLIFIARPLFRLWQVNSKLTVMFTHQFEPLIRSGNHDKLVELQNEPLEYTEDDNAQILMDSIEKENKPQALLRSDHFQKMIMIHSKPLGNLLLSYTEHEIFVVDPIRAKLIVWYSQRAPILQVCCNGNELFIWSHVSSPRLEMTTTNNNIETNQTRLKIHRLVIMAPTEFVIELHRLHRYLTMMAFIERFESHFRKVMALPLSGLGVITTEGGFLRNILINAWATSETKLEALELERAESSRFKKIIDEIVDESKQLKHSLENLNDSRFFLSMTCENIERLCSEPYTSFVSLEISLANLHSDRVIQFSKEALNRHKSVANLSQSIKNLTLMRQMAQSNKDLAGPRLLDDDQMLIETSEVKKLSETKNVLVQRQKPNKNKRLQLNDIDHRHISPKCNSLHLTETESGSESQNSSENCKPVIKLIKELSHEQDNQIKLNSPMTEDSQLIPTRDEVTESVDRSTSHDIEMIRCSNCHWPRARSHLRPIISSQRIQSRWLEDTMMDEFEKNVAEIEKHAFKHGLWLLFLRCLAEQNKFDDYVTCCILLNDVRLLNSDKFNASLGCQDDELAGRLLTHLSNKIDKINELQNVGPTDKMSSEFCIRCGTEYAEQIEQDDSLMIEDPYSKAKNEDEYSFNLVNLFDQSMMQPNVNIKRLLGRLLKFPQLLNNSVIPINFYLKTIRVAVATANQSPLSRAQINRLRVPHASTHV